MPHDDLERFPQRKNTRLEHYDYAQQNFYFVTICTANKQCIFGRPSQLSPMGQTAYTALQEIPQHFPDVVIDKFVVMPNHVHGIIHILKAGTNLSTVIGAYKAHVTKTIRAFTPGISVWQSSFHDHVIREQTDYLRIWEYIDTNPAKWEADCFYCEIPG